MFITLEGIEGSGKSTQLKLLQDRLLESGQMVSTTREPGWGKIGQLIRSLILDDKELDLSHFAELCLFCADRAQHVKEFIIPELEDGKIVICDRYFDSTIVYQGYGRENNLNQVKEMALASTIGTVPDVTFLLDISVEKSLKRITNRNELTKIDEEPVKFHEKIKSGYLEEAQLNKQRYHIINADNDEQSVCNDMMSIIATKLKK